MTTIRSGAPVLPPAVSTTAAAATATTPAATTTGAAAPADTFTPATNGTKTGTMTSDQIQKQGLDALNKANSPDAQALAKLLQQPSLSNDDVTQLQQLCTNIGNDPSISQADKASIGDATTSKMIDKGIGDMIVDQIKDMMSKAKIGLQADD